MAFCTTTGQSDGFMRSAHWSENIGQLDLGRADQRQSGVYRHVCRAIYVLLDLAAAVCAGWEQRRCILQLRHG